MIDTNLMDYENEDLMNKVEAIVDAHYDEIAFTGYCVDYDVDDGNVINIQICWYDDGYDCDKDDVTDDAEDLLLKLKEAGFKVGDLVECPYCGNNFYDVKVTQ